MMMKKIMFMTNCLSGGGAEKVLQTLLMNIDLQKYDITVYSMHRENIAQMNYPKEIHYKTVFDKYDGQGRILRRMDGFLARIKGKVFSICPSWVFYRLFIKGEYDVEIAFIEGESTKIVAGSSNKHSRKYAWVHVDLMKNPWTSFLYQDDEDEARHYRRFDKILCVSEAVRDSFLDKYRMVEPDRVCVQYNPICRESILALSQADSGLKSKEKLRMIAVGRLVEQKGFDRLLEACALLRQDGYDFELLILGDGCEREKLEKMIVSLQLQETVFLLGHQQNPYAAMRTGDLLVCSSRAEGFSTVLAEGVILGLPIISTDCAGVRELFGGRQCGRIVENSADGIYQGLRSALENPEQLEQYRQASLERGKTFVLSKTMAETEKLLDD